MPPPTSPSRTPLTSSVATLPENSNSNFVLRDFLHRMNELSANLLSQYTEPPLENHQVYSSPPEGPRMTNLPARIRNLASPIHFLPMPDLDLDMDLDLANPSVDLQSGVTTGLFSAPDLDDLSDLALSSELEGEIESSEVESGSDGSSEGNLDDGDDNGDDEDSDLNENGILDRIQLAQRLLLLSARQNHTNRNTLINLSDLRSHRNYGQLGGIALRRQNAIHMKHRRPAPLNLEHLAKNYHADFQSAVNAIKGLDSFVGKLPIFSRHPHASSKFSSRKWGSSRRLIRRTSYEGNMDRFLSHRRRGLLWLEAEESSEKCCGESWARKPEFKRKRPTHLNSQKRRKVSLKTQRKERNKRVYQLASYFGGDSISSHLLLHEEKLRILDGLPSSFLSSGSSFALDLLVRGGDSIDLQFSDVDLSQKSLHGHFNVKASEDRSGHIHLIIGFLSFLCGGVRSRYTINCTNKVIQTKLAILDHTFTEAIVERGLSNPNVVECLTSAFQIPFSGEIIDFNKNDLRFLPETRPVSPKASFSRSMHVSRIRNEQIKMQLGEWLKIRPFHNFSEAFFLNYLFFIEKYLREFAEAPKVEQELGIEFAKQMKELIYDITRDFEFMEDAKIPMVEEKCVETKRDIWERRRHEPRSNLHKSTFVQEWETKMCEKLCDYITCEDSCLLNVQLNYVLFTIRVDVSAALDQTFHKFIGLVSKESERKMLQKKYDAVCKEELSAEARECVFVCSLNRKTGRLEMQNTRLNLDYKNAGSCESRSTILRDLFGSSAGTFTDSDDDENLGPTRYSTFSSHWKYLEDPYLMDNPTVTMGMWKRGSLGSSTAGLANFA